MQAMFFYRMQCLIFMKYIYILVRTYFAEAPVIPMLDKVPALASYFVLMIIVEN